MSRVVVWFDKASPNQRKAAAVSGSLLLHLGLLLLLLPTTTGLSSIGTTGVGNVEGIGTTVTLVDASELIPPKASEAQSSVAQDVAASEPVSTAEATEPADKTQKVDAIKPKAEDRNRTKTEAVRSDSQAPSTSTADAAAGAHGQSGQSNTDLWNAIAPCWNRIADGKTLPATLKISFDTNGQLSIPPEIERDPDAEITDQNLRSEGQALQALAECGAYPMAEGQQGVVVQFAPPNETQVIKPNGQHSVLARRSLKPI